MFYTRLTWRLHVFIIIQDIGEIYSKYVIKIFII